MADDKKVKNPSEKLKEATKIASKAKQQNHVYNDVEEAVLKVYRYLSAFIDKLFFQGRYTAVFALLLALFLYASVNLTNRNDASTLTSSKVLSGVNVSTRYNSESFELSGAPNSCDIVLTGDAANVNVAAGRSGNCLLNLEGYTEGTHTIKLSASGYGDNVSAIVTPSETQITLKRKTTASFDISYDFINRNSLDSKYILGTPEFDGGSKVNIRASQDTLNSIAMVKALIDVSGMKEGSNSVDAPLIAYDSKGQQVNAEIVPSTIKVNVNVTSPSKVVPINLKISGEAPQGYALDSVTMDHQTTTIYASQAVLDTINEVTVSLDLSTITADTNVMLPVNLPSGVSSSDVTMVRIKATLSMIATKEINDVPIVYRNNDNNLGASYISTTTVTVIVSGSEANIENITASDCVAYIDLKDSNGNLLEPGDYDLNVYIEKNTNAYVSFSCDPNHIKITLIGQE